MGPVSNFLLRWLYIQSLIDEKTLITAPNAYTYPNNPLQQQYTDDSVVSSAEHLSRYKVNCRQALLMFRPGYDRLRALDSERLSCVSILFKEFEDANRVIKQYYATEESNSIPIENDENDIDLDAITAWHNKTSHNDLLNSKVRNLPNAEASSKPSEKDINHAKAVLTEARECLPQLVSLLLHSTPALTSNCVDPIQELRSLLIHSCLEDPTMGIELCWLLEAEVGRAWKTLFEHKDRTGRRLIVVLPHDKARALAKIGTEKRNAFDLLQDSEMATAFGVAPDYGATQNSGNTFGHQTSKLPSSISETRCAYFGDTMHFIDRLTQVSLDLRMVPVLQRKGHMEERLRDINRRIRRRMYTKGRRSLDENDGLGPDSFPQLSDISPDMVKHSVHLPLDPKVPCWQGSSYNNLDIFSKGVNESPNKIKQGLVRVLNIVTSECALLASRDRCPFLVILEVTDAGIEGNDARLYKDPTAQGLTLTESVALCLNQKSFQRSVNSENFRPFFLPVELLSSRVRQLLLKSSDVLSTIYDNVEFSKDIVSHDSISFLRGGWQGDGFYYAGDGYNPEYDLLYRNKQHDMHQKHQQLQPPSQLQPVPITPAEA